MECNSSVVFTAITAGTTLINAANGTISGTATATVTWSSSNTTVGVISGTGVFTALVAGTATITAASGSINGTATVTVNAAIPILMANITDFNVGNGNRSGAIKANVTVKNLDSVPHKFVTVVSGVNARGYPLAGTGVVVDLNPGQLIRIPVQVTVPPSANLGSYSLFAGVCPFDNEVLDPASLIGSLAGPGTATVS